MSIPYPFSTKFLLTSVLKRNKLEIRNVGETHNLSILKRENESRKS